MKFQVEKNADSECGDFFYGGGAGSRKELAADFKFADEWRELLGKFKSG